MDSISLTTFIDFVSKSGTPKLTVVREWKHREDYDPSTDYWKRLRESIVAMHQDGEGLDALDAVAASATEKKVANYRMMVKQYKKWARRINAVWFKPPRFEWESGEVSVAINPELGLEFGGAKHLLKLYFREEQLPKNRATLALQLMREGLRDGKGSAWVMSILDIRRCKLYSATAPVDALGAQLEGEAAYWAAVYPKV